MGILSAFLYSFIKSRSPSLLATPKWIYSFYQPKRKSPSSSSPSSSSLPPPVTTLGTLKSSLVNLLTNGAVIPTPLPIEDYRKRTKGFVDQKQKLKYQKKFEKSGGVRLGSKSEQRED
jgi:hypothetical protein